MTEWILNTFGTLVATLLTLGLTWLFSDKFRKWIKGKTLNLKFIIIIVLISQLPFAVYLLINYDNQENIAETTNFDLDSSWDIILNDDFNNIDSENYWHMGLLEDPDGDTNLLIEDGKLRFELTNCNSNKEMVFYRDLETIGTVDDAYISLDGESISGNDNRGFGIYFRSKNGSFYYFTIRDFKRIFSFLIYDDGKWTSILPDTKSEIINPNSSNELGVSFIGNEIKLYINDSLVGIVTDSRQLGGNIGLGALLTCPDGSVYEFDNLELYKP